MTDSKLRAYVRSHQLEIVGGITAATLASAYLLTVNLSAREGMKAGVRLLHSRTPIVKVEAQEVADILLPHILKGLAEDVTIELSPTQYEIIAQRVLDGMKAVKKAKKAAKVTAQALADA